MPQIYVNTLSRGFRVVPPETGKFAPDGPTSKKKPENPLPAALPASPPHSATGLSPAAAGDTSMTGIAAEDTDAEESGDLLYERLHITVDRGQEPMRIDKFLAARLPHSSRNKIQLGIDNGRVLVNQKQPAASYKVRPGDVIVTYSEKEIITDSIVPEDLPLNIVYEDPEVMIIDKPAGMVVHPGVGHFTGTLINGVAGYLRKQNPGVSEDNLPRFGMVHRIDKNTSGLLVLAKTGRAVTSLAKQFFDHTVQREYHALVWGDLAEDRGTVSAHIGRHQRFRKLFDAYPDGEQGKEAVTHYEVLERFGYVTLVKCVLETGRTHQIRVHMKFIGHPLFNDDTYGGDRIVKGTIFSKYKQFVENNFEICSRQALHARTLGFRHPGDGSERLFVSELPADIQTVIDNWRRYSTAVRRD